MEKLVLSAAIGFVLKQAAAYGANVKWPEVKTDAHAYIAPVCPDFAEPAVFEIVDEVVDGAQFVLQDTADLKTLADDLLAKNYSKAFSDLQALAVKALAYENAPKGVKTFAKACALAA